MHFGGSCLPGAQAARLALLMAAAFVVLSPTAAAPAGVSAAAAGFAAAARGVGRGGRLQVSGLQLEGETKGSTLELERTEMWKSGAQIIIHGPGGSRRVERPPSTAYFRGNVAGDPFSHALLAVDRDGSSRGVALSGTTAHALGKRRGAGRLQARRVPSAEGVQVAAAGAARARSPFVCSNVGTVQPPNRAPFNASTPRRRLQQFVQDQPLVVTIAVETDWELYQRFGDAAALADYVGDLLGYADLVYSREIGVDLRIGLLNVFTTADDPFSSSSDALELLDEMRSRWQGAAALQAVARSTTLYLSTKSSGGVAYMGTNSLCGWYDDKNNDNSFAFVGSLGGNFMWSESQAENPLAFVYDAGAVMHELGHNFNAPHTHDSCGLGGVADPVDRCVKGCRPATGLPTCSPNTPSPFFHTAGDRGEGTIMSYCHMANNAAGFKHQAATFGLGHNCGVKPERIPAEMKAYVQQRATDHPACFGVGVPSPPPSPPSPPSPPPQQGSLANPVVIEGYPFPYLSSASTVYFEELMLPLSNTCAVWASSDPFPVRVFRWSSGSARGTLVADTCDAQADLWMSVVSTTDPTSGPWTCEGAESSTVGACTPTIGLTKKTTVSVTQNRHYYFMVRQNIFKSSALESQSFRLRITASGLTLAPPSGPPPPPPRPAPKPPARRLPII